MEARNEYLQSNKELFLKVYFNLSYLFHRMDQQGYVLEYTNKGIDLSLQSNDYSILPSLLFRKAVALNKTNCHDESRKNFRDALFLLQFQGKHKLYDHYKGIVTKDYYADFQEN